MLETAADLTTGPPSDSRLPKPRPITLSALQLAAGQVATTALSIILAGAIGRSLGAPDFAVWYLLNTILGVVFVFVDWGYSQYIIREIARTPERAGELTGTVLVMRTVAALIMCGPAMLATSLLGYDTRTVTLTVVVCVAWLPSFLMSSFSWAFRGSERMDREALATVILKVLLLLSTFASLAVSASLATVIVGQAAGGVLGFVSAAVLYRHLGLPRLRVTLSAARELLTQAAPIFTMGLMISLQPYIDANMLAKLVPASVLGWYGASASISGTLMAPAVILAGTVFPRLARATGDRVLFGTLVRGSLRVMFFVAVLGAVGTYLFAETVVAWIYADQFRPAAMTLQAFSPSLVLVSIDMLLGNALLAVGRISILARAKVVAVVVTTAAEIVLIPFCQTEFGNGGVGIMLSFICGELVLIATALYLMPRGVLNLRCGLDALRAAAAGAFTFAAVRLSESLMSPLAAIAVAIAVYTAMALAVGLITRSDVNTLTKDMAARRRLTVKPSPAVLLP